MNLEYLVDLVLVTECLCASQPASQLASYKLLRLFFSTVSRPYSLYMSLVHLPPGEFAKAH